MDKVMLSMGSGGRLSQQLIEDVFLAGYGNAILNDLDDSAEVRLNGTKVAFTTDCYTVKPIFFPGGDIGKLAICGTVNDLAAKGAKPLAISAGFIIEEGFAMDYLKKIAASMHDQAKKTGVSIVTGDTKVVRKNEADGIFINTSGIGLIFPGMDISCHRVLPGDEIILSGGIAEHGIAILNARESLGFSPAVSSDVCAVYPLVEKITQFGRQIHAMRDPTRGGLATVLNEIAKGSDVKIRIFEQCVPIKPQVQSCCELLGLDPLYIANEGKLVIFASASVSRQVLHLLRQLPEGRDAAIIGRVEGQLDSSGMPAVTLETRLGTSRFLPLIDADPLPRIC